MSEPATSASTSTHPESFGRYVLHAPIARGGMATVHTARLTGAEGFCRLVAAKRLHPQFAEDPDFVAMFHDEARIASKIHHPNVVPVLDVVLSGQEVILVQEYVHGVPLDRLFNAALGDQTAPIPVGIAVAIIAGVLSGLHAAHETRDESNEPLNIVHRDVSPQNVMVSVDGIPRLLDFGIAKAKSCVHVTREGLFKGKIAYMAPEQLRAEDVTRTADIYAAGVLLWELLAHRRLHAGRREAQIFGAVLTGTLPSLSAALDDPRTPISNERRQQILALEPIVAQALASDSLDRFSTAEQMLDAILEAAALASPMEVSAWVRNLGADYLERRQKVLASDEESWRSLSKIPSAAPSGPTSENMRYSESGVKVVGRDTPPPSHPAGAFSAPPVTAPSEAPHVEVTYASSSPKRMAVVPWSIVAALLLVSGALLGVLAARRPNAEPVSVVRQLVAPSAFVPPTPYAVAAAANPRETRAAAASPPPAETPIYSPVVVLASPPRRAPAPTPAAKAAPAPAPAQPPANPTMRVAPVAPAATTPPAPTTDCNPPFYFEGSKKLYKPSCI